jgi:hypothetical protein
MKRLLCAVALLLMAFNVQATGLLVTDIESGTAVYPSVLEQVRKRLIQENFSYSYLEGDLTLYKKINFKKICLEFSTSKAMAEMKLRIEAGLVSPEGSKYPSAITVTEVESCLVL